MAKKMSIAVAATLVFSVLAAALPVASSGAESAAQAQTTTTLTPDSALSTALDHLAANHNDLGLAKADIDGASVIDIVPLSGSAAYAVHLQQEVDGIDVVGGLMVVVVGSDGRVRSINNRFEPGVAKLVATIVPEQSGERAVAEGVKALGLDDVHAVGDGPDDTNPVTEVDVETVGVDGGTVPVELVLHPEQDGELRLAWDMTIDPIESDGVWQVLVDAETGEEIERTDLERGSSYEVFAGPTQSPSHGTRSTVVGPADPVASPFGWHDTDGVAGPESTLTEGNNVSAYTDIDGDNRPDVDSQPDGGADLVFSFPLALDEAPAASAEASVSNLFYWTNRVHDVLYAYGFDEASGNFQANNYGRGGVGGDVVRAEAQDGFANNNARFFTPPDGAPARMQLYLWTRTSPSRDAGFDAGMITHEYVHGLTDRLTGGPSVNTCITNNEQPGEGWSDYFALMLTMKEGDISSEPRGFGTYLVGQPTTGRGLRQYPYSTDLGVDPRTYSDVVRATVPHGVGSIFAAMLWDVTWNLIGRDGFDPDLIRGDGGNNIAMQLVVDALKIQPCETGFVDARDAMLVADDVRYDGANRCLIWTAFAKRGLGFSADQGDPDSATDGVEAFDLPPACSDIALSVVSSTGAGQPGRPLTLALTATNTSAGDLTGINVVAPIPDGTAYVPGSADCDGSESAGVVTFNIGTISAADSTVCRFTVTVNDGSGTSTLFEGDGENGLERWSIDHGQGSIDWEPSTGQSHSPPTSFRAGSGTQASDQYLRVAAPVAVGPSTELRFWHRFVTENTWDGGVVEVSDDGVQWTDLGPQMRVNGYRDLLRQSSNPLAGRLAFTGSTSDWIQTTVDLSPFAGSSVFIRFRYGTDAGQSEDGWFVDDVEILNPVEVHTTATATSDTGTEATTSLITPIGQQPEPGLLRVTTNPAVPSLIEVDGLWTDAFGLDWVQHREGNYQVCFNDVPGFTTPECEQVEVHDGSTTAVEGTFIPHGTLDIVTSPPVASTVTVGGDPVNDWGAIVSVEPGDYEVCFGSVARFEAPPCQDVTVEAGVIHEVTGRFSPDPTASGPAGFGMLRVVTDPPVPSQLVVNGVRTVSYGMDWMKLTPGSYEVCYTDVPGFTSPGCETVVVIAGATTVAQGRFEALAEVRVLTSPPVNQPLTANGRTIDQYGFWSWLPADEPYELCTTGYRCQTVSPAGAEMTSVTLER